LADSDEEEESGAGSGARDGRLEEEIVPLPELLLAGRRFLSVGVGEPGMRVSFETDPPPTPLPRGDGGVILLPPSMTVETLSSTAVLKGEPGITLPPVGERALAATDAGGLLGGVAWSRKNEVCLGDAGGLLDWEVWDESEFWEEEEPRRLRARRSWEMGGGLSDGSLAISRRVLATRSRPSVVGGSARRSLWKKWWRIGREMPERWSRKTETFRSWAASDVLRLGLRWGLTVRGKSRLRRLENEGKIVLARIRTEYEIRGKVLNWQAKHNSILQS
jgi:hypothetical protein